MSLTVEELSKLTEQLEKIKILNTKIEATKVLNDYVNNSGLPTTSTTANNIINSRIDPKKIVRGSKINIEDSIILRGQFAGLTIKQFLNLENTDKAYYNFFKLLSNKDYQHLTNVYVPTILTKYINKKWQKYIEENPLITTGDSGSNVTNTSGGGGAEKNPHVWVNNLSLLVKDSKLYTTTWDSKAGWSTPTMITEGTQND